MNARDPLHFWHDVRSRWRDGGLERLAHSLDDKLMRVAAGGDEAQLRVLTHWLEALNEEDPACALAVADRLDGLLSPLNADALGRWILTGLRLYPNDAGRQRAYFLLEDVRAVEALRGEAGAGNLDGHLPSLALLLNGFTGTAMHVQARRQTALNAPPLRPVLTRSHLLLPDDVTTLDGPDLHRLYRAAVAHAVAHLRHSPAGLPTRTLKPMSIAVVSAIEDARVERLLIREFPGLHGWFLEFLVRAAESPGLSFASLISRMNLALIDPRYQDDNHWVNKARTLFEAQAADLSDYAAFRRIGSILANDLGQMRVRFQPRQYAVPAAYRDDNSFLWDYGESKGSPPESHDLVVPNPSMRPASRDAAPDDALAHAPSSEVELGRAAYPEWDHRLSLARANWCTVIEKRPTWQVRLTPGQAVSAPDALPLIPLTSSRQLSRTRRRRASGRVTTST